MARFIVEIPRMHGMSKREARIYIKDAVSAWANGSNPDHPFFGVLNAKGAVVVKELSAEEEARVARMLEERKGRVGHNPKLHP